MPSNKPQGSRGSAGFSVLELVVSLFVLALILVAMLGLFDATNRVARAQANVSDTQQAVRIAHDEMVRLTRMAGRGWRYPAVGVTWRASNAIQVQNNVNGSTYIDGSSNPALKVLPGTDILRVSGVIQGSIFESNAICDTFLLGSAFLAESTASGIQQEVDDLERLRLRVGTDPIPVLAVDRLGGVQVYNASLLGVRDPVQPPNPCPRGRAMEISVEPSVPGAELRSAVAVVGVLEDYAFYVRENGGEPKLSVARFAYGTTQPHENDPQNLRQDLADDIIDLQVALAIDDHVGGGRGDGVITANEWWYDPAGDVGAPPALNVDGRLFYVRINTLGRTSGADFQYVAPPITRIEDHVYSETAQPTNETQRRERQHRRRLLSTLVDARNL